MGGLHELLDFHVIHKSKEFQREVNSTRVEEFVNCKEQHECLKIKWLMRNDWLVTDMHNFQKQTNILCITKERDEQFCEKLHNLMKESVSLQNRVRELQL